MKALGRIARTSIALGAVSALVVGAGGLTAWADNVVVNDVNLGSGTTGVSVSRGGSSVLLPVYIQGTGGNGGPSGGGNCNATTSSPITISITGAPAGVSISPAVLTFTSCGNAATQNFSVAATAGTALGDTTVQAIPTGGTGTTNADTTVIRVVASADNTAPVITPTVTGTLGSNGWYTSNVNVSWSVVDAESSATTTGCGNQSVTADTSGATFTCSATSAGGTTSQSVSVKRDATAPSITSSVSPARPGSGWWNEVSGAPTASFTCSDATSGVAAGACEGAHLFGEGEDQSFTGTVTDRAGNTNTTSVSNIDVDLTDPTADAALSGAAGDDGWFVGTIGVDWTVSDSLSGPVTGSCPDTSVTVDGQDSVSCTPTDVAGNTGTAVNKAYKLDQAKPTISAAVSPGVDPSGWWNIATGAPTVTYTCGDATSGVKSCSNPYTFGEGADQTDTGTAKDNAGNTDTATVSGINVDLTAPTVTYSLAGPEGDNDWYTGDVTIDWIVSDTGSGVAIDCEDDHLTTDTDGTTFTCTATDTAGNTTTITTTTIKRDATAPEITWNSLINGGDSYYFGAVPASPTCSASDVLSGVAAGGCSVGGYGTTVGAHTLTASASDDAGNVATESRNYTVLSWTARGFYRPVDMGNIWNTVKGGSTVPLKFEAFAGPTELTDVASTVKSYNVSVIACTTLPGATVEDPIEVLASTGGTTMRYDWVEGQFIQNWATPKRPGICYQATVKFQDGSRLDAFFKLK